MSFLNFSKDKENNEHAAASEIKTAAISDTQLNSLSSNADIKKDELGLSMPSASGTLSDLSTPRPVEQTVSVKQDFVNPFSNPDLNAKSDVGATNPISSPSNNPNLGINEPKTSNVTVNPNLSTPIETKPEIIQQQVEQPKVENVSPSPIPSSQNLNSSSGSLTEEQIRELIDETVEKIIEEKWDVMINKVDKVLRWKDKIETEVNIIKEDIANIVDGFTKLEGKLVNKISNYDKNILDVNSEIKALEKVFQKVTPTLINNVNELSKITKDLKEFDKKNSNKSK